LLNLKKCFSLCNEKLRIILESSISKYYIEIGEDRKTCLRSNLVQLKKPEKTKDVITVIGEYRNLNDSGFFLIKKSKPKPEHLLACLI